MAEMKAIVAAMVASSAGIVAGSKSVKDESRTNIAIVIAFVGVLMTFAAFVVTHLK